MQSFDLFDWGSSNGSFSSVDFSGAKLAAGLTWDTSKLHPRGEVRFSAVAEPQTWGLLLGGLGLLGHKVRPSGKAKACKFTPGAGAIGDAVGGLDGKCVGSRQATTTQPARIRSKLLMAALVVAVRVMAGAGIRKDAHGNDRPGGDIQHSLLAQADPGLCVRQ